MKIINLDMARRFRTLRSLNPLEFRVASRWYKKTSFADIVRLREQRGGNFYIVNGGRI